MGGRGSSYKSNYLGKRGKAISIEQAMKNTNPNYTTFEPKWTRNCQRCVFAYEMQRRGYDVEAKPRILDGTDELPYASSPGGWAHVMSGMEMKQMPSRNTASKMEDQMAEWGEGSRAIVKVTWKTGYSGHVFNAERVNGKTRYIDAQSGSEVSISSYLNEAIKGRTQLWRVDNATPTDLLEKCVKKRE